LEKFFVIRVVLFSGKLRAQDGIHTDARYRLLDAAIQSRLRTATVA
jgi:hypothetical protein